MSIRVEMLGGNRVLVDGRVASLSDTATRLLVQLVLARAPIARRAAATTLWPDSPERGAMSNLRTAIWRAQHVGNLLTATDESVWLAPEIEVDVWERLDWVERVRADVAAEARLWRQHRVRDELLPGCYDEQVVVERERIRHLSLRAMDQIAGRLRESDRLEGALEVAMEALCADPLRVAGYRSAVECLLALGEPAEAARLVAQCDEVFESSQGLAAPADLRDLLLGSRRRRSPSVV